MDTIRFPSRIDRVLALIAFSPVVAAAWGIRSQATAGFSGELIIAAFVTAMVLLLLLWIYLDTSYALTATDLLIRGGPVRVTIPLATIRKVRRSHTILAGPALSMKRLEIDHGKYDTAIISPRDQAGFVSALVTRAPHVVIEPLK